MGEITHKDINSKPLHDTARIRAFDVLLFEVFN